MVESTFGFEIVRIKPREGEAFSRFRVELPHQCDKWEITNSFWGTEGVQYEDAVASLELFIKEAQNALTDLRSKEWD